MTWRPEIDYVETILLQRGLRQIPELGEGATFLRKWGFVGILIGVGV